VLLRVEPGLQEICGDPTHCRNDRAPCSVPEPTNVMFDDNLWLFRILITSSNQNQSSDGMFVGQIVKTHMFVEHVSRNVRIVCVCVYTPTCLMGGGELQLSRKEYWRLRKIYARIKFTSNLSQIYARVKFTESRVSQCLACAMHNTK